MVHVHAGAPDFNGDVGHAAGQQPPGSVVGSCVLKRSLLSCSLHLQAVGAKKKTARRAKRLARPSGYVLRLTFCKDTVLPGAGEDVLARLDLEAN